MVVGEGLEPPARGFSVYRSPNQTLKPWSPSKPYTSRFSSPFSLENLPLMLDIIDSPSMLNVSFSPLGVRFFVSGVSQEGRCTRSASAAGRPGRVGGPSRVTRTRTAGTTPRSRSAMPGTRPRPYAWPESLPADYLQASRGTGFSSTHSTEYPSASSVMATARALALAARQ